METEPDSLEEVDRLLAKARRSLQEFEDGADRSRLLLRVRTASPAHPVLLARLLFAGAAGLAVVGSIGVLFAPLISDVISDDIARTIAAFDEVIPYVPDQLPALPSLLLVLALVMVIGWVFATYAAISLGRDTTMLPWEQKQHQKLVNDVTRLTTQRAVMERIKATPQGARPRIATPVPASTRGRQPSPPVVSALSRTGTPSGAARAEERAAFGAADAARSGRGGLGASATAGGSSFGASGGAFAGGFGARAGAASASRSPAPVPTSYVQEDPAPRAASPAPGTAPASAPKAAQGGLLSRAKSKGGPGGSEANAPRTPAAASADGASGSSLAYSPPSGGRALVDEEPTPHQGGVRLGGVRLGARSDAAAPTNDDLSGLVEFTDDPDPHADAPVVEDVEEPEEATPPPGVGGRGAGRLGAAGGGARFEVPEDLAEVDQPASAVPSGGILGRARAGATHLRSTPFGAAGRIRPPGGATASRGPTRPTSSVPPDPAARGGSLPAPSTAASTAADPSVRSTLPSAMFRPPAGAAAERPAAAVRTLGTPTASGARLPAAKVPPSSEVDESEEVSAMEEEYEAPPPPRPSPEPARGRAATPAGAPPLTRPFPAFGPIDAPWLVDALQRAEELQRTFPIQAHLQFSQEPHLPFTLVIARATPAMAVRAMVSFVEFLATVATPPRARIELVNIPHLDRSFHKNVEAALAPYFQQNVEVEANPGQVDIQFNEPAPEWGDWPTLPVLDPAP